MLRSLDIRDMLLIDRLDLRFQPGLNVLTGETGAGKSILLDSLGFVLGWRGRADLVRTGAAQGEVTAVFDLADNHPARAILRDAGLPDEDELILRRVNTAEGRKTGWVNDRRVSGEVLRALSAMLVELHGQHDDRGLLNAAGHRALLDDYAGHEALLREAADAWEASASARLALRAAEDALAEARQEEDFLRHAVAELEQLAPEPGEDAQLDSRRRMMQAAERIREDVLKASQVLGPEGAEGALGDGLRWLEGALAQSEGRLEAPMAALERAMVELDDAMRGVADCLDAMTFDPHELETVEERLFAIRALARKHNVTPDDLPELAQSLTERLDALDRGTQHIAGLRRAVSENEAAYDAAARALSASRKEAAARLDAAVMAELAPLRMERAVFHTEISPGSDGASGRDSVAFAVATNPGAPAGPIGKIASGGELSRFLLALKVCLSERRDAGVTMIFDEIDRGVGGATASAVGRRLAALAESGQVLVVTHSPQVAALAGHHWRVEKQVAGNVTTSRVISLDARERESEIARMLAGDRITDEARAAARALLQD